jgi:hypothetical protein
MEEECGDRPPPSQSTATTQTPEACWLGFNEYFYLAQSDQIARLSLLVRLWAERIGFLAAG